MLDPQIVVIFVTLVGAGKSSLTISRKPVGAAAMVSASFMRRGSKS
jgi:hypothetical protein